MLPCMVLNHAFAEGAVHAPNRGLLIQYAVVVAISVVCSTRVPYCVGDSVDLLSSGPCMHISMHPTFL